MVAVQNRIFSPSMSLRKAVQNGFRNVFRLALLRIRTMQTNFLAGAVVCPQLFALTAGIVADDLVCRGENVLRGAVVLLQTDGFGVPVLLLKFQNIRDGRTAEFIDTLVIVTDNTDVFIAARKQADEHILRMVGVLILITEHIAEFALIILQHILVLLKQLDGFHNNIIKIQRIGLAQRLGVFPINGRNRSFEFIALDLSGIFLRCQQIVLRSADHAGDCTHIKDLLIQIAAF